MTAKSIIKSIGPQEKLISSGLINATTDKKIL